jgi:TATA-box binding protein (TBP) (component of TFIID and TFIIIB)
MNTDDCVPKATDIYISTKSKIAYLNQEIDLKSVFWNVPVISYSTPANGIIKKQMKFNSITVEELNIIQENLKKESYFEEQVITNINNPNGRIKFKDIRKVSIGICKKDLTSYRCKKKSAFYNCFVMILRLKVNDIFKEYHIKVFNTGKMEIPGIQNDSIFHEVITTIRNILIPFTNESLAYLNKSDTVLINSNFNCGFYINREALYDILKIKYNIQCIYDPCSYPGIQSKFYYSEDKEIQDGRGEKKNINTTEVSFMIFRTGSILIVGMCEENVLHSIYEFLKKLLAREYYNIYQKANPNEIPASAKNKQKKIRKKTIIIHA